jgi:hypothetical protein
MLFIQSQILLAALLGHTQHSPPAFRGRGAGRLSLTCTSISTMTAYGEIAHHGLLSVEDQQLVSAAATSVTVQRSNHEEFSAEPAELSSVVEQTSSIDALLHGAYEGDVSFGELSRHGNFGLGTVQHLDGEMLCLDGEFLQVRADGSVHGIPPETLTPFAVMCHSNITRATATTLCV